MYFYPREQPCLLVSDSFIKPQKKTTVVQTRKSSSALACRHLISELLLMLWLAINTNSLSQSLGIVTPHLSTEIICLSQQSPGYGSALQDLSLSSESPNTDELVQIKLLTTIMAVQMGAINFSMRQTLSGFTDC